MAFLESASFLVIVAVLVILWFLRPVIFTYFNVNKQMARTKHPTDAKLEYLRGGSVVRTVSIKKKKNSCLITVSFIEDGKEVTESSKEVDAALMDELENIAIDRKMQELKNLPYSNNEEGSRSFSLFYGRQSVYHVDRRQEHYEEIKELLDEEEACIKKYLASV